MGYFHVLHDPLGHFILLSYVHFITYVAQIVVSLQHVTSKLWTELKESLVKIGIAFFLAHFLEIMCTLNVR